jgi:hypothetical protein
MARQMTADLPSETAQTPFLHAVLADIARRWWLLPAGMLLGLGLVTIHLNRTEHFYSAELKVHPAPSTSGKPPASPLGGLAAIAGLSGAAGGSEAVTPFRFYLDGLYSLEVANRLARDQALMQTIFVNEWDAQAQQWHAPRSLSGSIRAGVAGLLGLPRFGWTPPDGARLQGYIAYAVTVRQSVKTPVVTLVHDYPDPAFAGVFLTRLHTTLDAYLREQQAARTRGNIVYLSGELQKVTLADQRRALVTALAEQERQAMLVFAEAPYAADPLDSVVVSSAPTRPRAVPLLAGGAVVGLLLGLVLALVTARRARRHG